VLVRIASTSGGNPFYALEIARSLVREGAALAPGDRLHVPQSLQELVLARVSALSSQGREVLLVVSALSRPTVSTIAAVLDAPGVAAKAIIEAEEAGVILTDRTRIRFTHPLLASAVYASASQERMRRLHRRLADVVSDPEDRARHLAQGTIEGDETTAVEIEEAAERAARRGAPDAAAELYDAAVRLTPDDRHDDATRRGCGQAAALLAGGDPGGARAIAELALARASSATRRGEALFLLSEIAWVESPGRAPMDYLESALAEAGDDRRLRGRIHAKLAEFSLLDHPRVLEHADAAAALLSEDEDPGLLAAVLLNKVFFSAQVGQGAHHDLLERALRLEDRAGQDVERNRVGLIWFACMDELDAARTRYEFEDRWYRDRGEEGWRAERLGMLAWAEFNGGNWSTAEQAIEQSCTTLEQMGGPSGPWGMMFHFRAVIDAHRGRTERARETLRLLIEELEQTEHLFFAGISLSALGSVELTEDPEAANQMFQQMRRHFDSIGAVDPIGTRTEPDEVEALLALGEIESARAALDRLEWRGRLIPRPWISAALPRVRGLVHAAEDDTAAAIANFDALDLVAATRVPFEHARTLLVKGRLHRRLKQKRAAADALSESLALFRQLGAPLWEERAQAELGRVGLRRPATGELTASERRVAELAASGLTNREVAKAAFMSPKTVEANLARIYRKLGIKSRAELGAKIAGEARGHPTAKT
jgi:DNA-binding CsgD family transcriptional regulator